MPILSHWPYWHRRQGGGWSELWELQREMRRLFDEGLEGFFDRRGASRRFPLVNVYETSDEIVVLVEVPGMSVGELELTVTGDTLKLEGDRRLELPEGASFVCQERQHGRFSRVVALPHSVDAEGAKAEYLDGVLSVALPKATETKPRTIQVKTT